MTRIGVPVELVGWHDIGWLDDLLTGIEQNEVEQNELVEPVSSRPLVATRLCFLAGDVGEPLLQVHARARDRGWLVPKLGKKDQALAEDFLSAASNILSGSAAIWNPLLGLLIQLGELTRQSLRLARWQNVGPGDFYHLLDRAQVLAKAKGYKGVILILEATEPEDERWLASLTSVILPLSDLHGAKLLCLVNLRDAPLESKYVDGSYPDQVRAAAAMDGDGRASWVGFPALTAADIATQLKVSYNDAQTIATRSAGDSELASRMWSEWRLASRNDSAASLDDWSLRAGLEVVLERRGLNDPDRSKLLIDVLHCASVYDKQFCDRSLAYVVGRSGGSGDGVTDLLDALADDQGTETPLLVVKGHDLDEDGLEYTWRYSFLDEALGIMCRALEWGITDDLLAETVDSINFAYPGGGPLDAELARLLRLLRRADEAAEVELRRSENEPLTYVEYDASSWLDYLEGVQASDIDVAHEVSKAARRLIRGGQYDEALRLADRAAQLAGRVTRPNPHHLGQILVVLARAEAAVGKYSEALITAESAVNVIDELASMDPTAHHYYELGVAQYDYADLLQHRDPEAAYEFARDALRNAYLGRDYSSGDVRGCSWGLLGSLKAQKGDYVGGARRMLLSIEIFSRVENYYQQIKMLLVLAQAARNAEEYGDALDACTKAMDLLNQQDPDLSVLSRVSIVSTEFARCLRAIGEFGDAFEAADQACGISTTVVEQAFSPETARQFAAARLERAELRLRLHDNGVPAEDIQASIGDLEAALHMIHRIGDPRSAIDVQLEAQAQAGLNILG